MNKRNNDIPQPQPEKIYHSILIFLFLILFSGWQATGQLSPGKLTTAHTRLEGLSNCTSCHELGDKVTNSKCLECHKEMKSLISQKKGYHSSTEVQGKECIGCHSEHHGTNFQIVHFDTLKFDHQLTGYELKGKHAKTSCNACHKSEFIKTKISQKKANTYLGLDTKCLSCHEDYHQKTLSPDCASCHSQESFRPTVGFKHEKTKFQLRGQHAKVDCLKCHTKEQRNGKDFQRFSGIEFANCTACHKDVHENKFGNDCRKCHSESSFHQVSGMNTFDHSRTDFPLIGKHEALDCKKCHKGSYTAAIKYKRCVDCHSDFHKGQFRKNEISPDCNECHTEKAFQGSTYNFERHNKTGFKLEGAHAATPCLACHKQTEEWKFRNLDKQCAGCHKNIHENQISEKFIPEGKCETCHTVYSWNQVTFDHKTTDFDLKGKHAEKTCRDCHFKKEEDGQVVQRFMELKTNCESCHQDLHQKQFSKNGATDCIICHGGFENWKADRFNHSTTRFKLEGGHKDVACKKCHLENKSGIVPFTQYKNTKMLCSSCHLQSR